MSHAWLFNTVWLYVQIFIITELCSAMPSVASNYETEVYASMLCLQCKKTYQDKCKDYDNAEETLKTLRSSVTTKKNELEKVRYHFKHFPFTIHSIVVKYVNKWNIVTFGLVLTFSRFNAGDLTIVYKMIAHLVWKREHVLQILSFAK